MRKNEAPTFHALSIVDIRRDTTDSLVLSFAIPPHLDESYAFTPGQYLTLRATINGQDVRRSYSICSPLGAPSLSVGIKQIEDGLFSNFAQRLCIGDEVQVMTPQGRFTAAIGGTHNYLLLAAGSGVTPILSIAQSVLDNENESTVTLCYGNKRTNSVMFRKQFDDLKDHYMTRFLLTHLMTEESQDIELFNGRLDKEKIHTMTTRGLISPTEYDAIYICGPQSMITSATEAFEELEVDRANIRHELFTSSTDTKPLMSDNKTAPNTAETNTQVEIVLDGSRRTFEVLDNEAILDAASRAGFEIPYSCANGMCATCRCKLTQGSGTMAQNFSLEEWELEEGYVLACQLVPESNNLVLDFDAV